MSLALNKPKLDNLAGDIWKSAERLRGKFKAYEYQNVILPIIVIRRLECVLIDWREKRAAEVLAKRPKLTAKELAQLVKELELNPKQCPFSNKTDWTLRKVYEEDHALLEENFRAYVNGSPLSNGDCGSGESEIRRWILENDWRDAIVMLPDQLFYNTGIFTYIWLLRNEKPASHRGRVMLIDARQQFEKEPKAFSFKRNRMTDDHRAWVEERYFDGWAKNYSDEQVKIFRREDFAYHKVGVVFWQTDENDKPAIVTEPYEKNFTAANVAKELEFYCAEPRSSRGNEAHSSSGGKDQSLLTSAATEIKFTARVKADGKEKTVNLALTAKDNAAKKFKAAFADADEILSVEWTHRHYVQDDEYIPRGEDIEAFLKREIAKPIIRWEDSPQLGYEILPNKYFYRYQPPTPAKELLAEFWKLEKEAEEMLKGLAQ